MRSSIDRSALRGPVLEVARALLGTLLVRDDRDLPGGRRFARIVEVEAYGGRADRASHARVGRTARTAVMFGPAGIAYVYLVYGMYDCLNIVTGTEGDANAVLIRAVSPLAGADLMRRDRVDWYARRRRASAESLAHEIDRLARTPDERLASGPGLVGAAFGLDRGWTGTELLDPASPLRLEGELGTIATDRIAVGPRIGVAYAGEPWASLPWRMAIAGDPAVSRPQPAP